MNYLLSPHDDDAALFAAITCLREKPTIVVVTDSYVQPARGEVGCSADERAAESEQAHAILGCATVRMGLRDDDLTREQLETKLLFIPPDVETVYVPALEGGHEQHDMVAQAAANVFGRERLSCYSTYAKLSQYREADLHPVGTTEIEWTREEYALKMQALNCYTSQLRVNRQHFTAVENRSEWLSGYRRVHLGCGNQLKDGWLNIDWCRPCKPSDAEFVQSDCSLDVLTNVAGEHETDYIFSEDFLEHVPPDRRVHVLNQCWAVLREGGIMEHYVPNAGSRNDYGSPSHLSHWNLQTFEHFDVDSYRWKKDRCFEGIIGGFRKVSADLVNWQKEDDGVSRAQSIRVRYRAVEC